MKSFLSSLRKLDSSTDVLRDRIVSHRQSQLFTTLLLSGAIIGSSIGIIAPPATAAPARKDWCSQIWSVDNNTTLTSINPVTGLTTTAAPPNLTMPTGTIGTSVTTLGVHTESGTMFAFDRGNAAAGGVPAKPSQLYKYKFGVDSNWVAVSITNLIGLKDTQPITGASNNLNKMTVDGNTLFIAESNGIAVYAISLNSSGSVVGNTASIQTYSYVDDPADTPPHRSFANGDIANVTKVIGGGDLTTDEYGDVYNITYDNTASANNGRGTLTTTKAYFYKQSGNTWVYQGETGATANFAGAAFYQGSLYVKSSTQLKKVPLVRSGSGYTGWSDTLSDVGTASTGFSSGDLAACGTPNITMTKTQQIYADAALTTLVADQTKVKTGQYIKYTITAQNTGTSWARNTTITDSLPTGTTYVPDSASLNGTSLGLTTYPTSGFVLNAPGSAAGIVPYSTGVAGSDTATVSFAVQVTALNGAVQNQATVAYVDNSGLPSEPSVCTSPLLNCSITPSVTVTALDFGDAPDGSAGTATGNYKTTEADNGPNHQITAGLKLGATAPDKDNGLQQDVAANADGVDEDAFTSLPNVPTTGTYSLTNVPVTNTTGSAATLHAWVDFNNNGSLEAGEYTSATVANNATSANLSWAVPAGTVAGSTYARFRLTTQALTDSVGTSEDDRSFGAANNGEVEDYQVSIEAVVAPIVCPTLITGEFGGTFGTINSTTKYRNLQSPVSGYTYTAPTNTGEGQYIVTSAAYGSKTWNGFGQNITGHTTGAVDDAFLLVNGATTIGTFYQQTINVTPNRDLEVGVWARNWAGLQFSANPPTIALRVYAANGTTLLGSATVANISNAAAWVQALANINTGSNTQIVVKLQNLSTQFSGNDFAIDDFSVRSATTPCLDGIASDPNVLLVKRITGINGGTSTVGGDSLAGYIDSPTNPYDDNNKTILTKTLPTDPPKDTDKWPLSTLIGGINGGRVKPGDEMEYTIYFLSTGDSPAKNVLLCDRVPTNTTFIPNSFNIGTTADPLGLSTADRGIIIERNGIPNSYTNIADGDVARYYPQNEPLPNGCKAKITDPPLPNPNGTVVVNLGNIPNATTAGEAGTYGFVRFRGRVK